jgi:hypothetical protein
MEAGELKTFLTDSAGNPPTDFEPALDDRNRYLDWWSVKLREHYGVVTLKVTSLDVEDPNLRSFYLDNATLVTTLSFEAFEATFYIRMSDLNLSVLEVHSKVHGEPKDYLDEWELHGPPIIG